jgi:predicted aldo/keto reductase-like oxidoreductase
MGMMQLTQAEIEALKRYEAAITPYYCHRCDACRETCPMRVNVSEINRSLMYAEGGYHDLSLARSTYRKIPAAASAKACGNCPQCAQCTAACPYGVNIGARMRRAQALFA